METVMNRTRSGKLVIYPTLTPVTSEAEQLDAILATSSLGRQVLSQRAKAAADRGEPLVPRGMSLTTRDRLLRTSALGRAVLAQEERRRAEYRP